MANTAVQRQIRSMLNSGIELTASMINLLISDHRSTADHTKSLYERYKASKSGVPIFNRVMPNVQKINSKVNNDFFSEIVDTKVGYIVGTPISYYLDKSKYTFDDQLKSSEYDKQNTILENFTVRNSVNDLDAELVKMVSICGHAGREIFIDTDGNERIANLNAWETIFLTNGVGEVEYALRYYTITELNSLTSGEEDKEVIKVEFFDNEKVTYYKEVESDDGESLYVLDPDYPTNPVAHPFDTTPIIKVVNNAEEQGDAEKVLELIDAYDRAVSDVNSEIEQFRLAYMYFKGAEPSPETIENARQTGAYYVGETGEVGFITKNINDAVIEHHLNRLEDNILRFSKHVNFGDEQFANNLSGISMRYKLFALESKAMTLETKMQSALRNQFRIITSAWQKRSVAVDYLNLIFVFKRNLPINLIDESQSSATLKGIVSEHTRLSQLSFVDDVEYEIQMMKQDEELYKVVVDEEVPVTERYKLGDE